MESLGRWLTQLGVWTAHPLAGLVVLAYALFWWLDSPETFEWHGIATSYGRKLVTAGIGKAAYRGVA